MLRQWRASTPSSQPGTGISTACSVSGAIQRFVTERVVISTAYTISGELQHPHHSLEQVSTLHAPSVDSFKTDHRKAVGVCTTSHHCSCQTWPMPLASRNRNSTVRKPRAVSLMWWPLRKYYDTRQKQKQASKQQTSKKSQTTDSLFKTDWPVILPEGVLTSRLNAVVHPCKKMGSRERK